MEEEPNILEEGGSEEEGRPSRTPVDPTQPHWECSVCTYKNTEEEFKCAICESRKGTSTRKPRANSQTAVVQIQALAAEAAKQVTSSAQKHKRRLIRQQQRSQNGGAGVSRYSRAGRLRNVDRAKATKLHVTVNDVTVVITDYPQRDQGESNGVNRAEVVSS